MFKAKTLQSTTEKCSSWITYQQIISNQRWVKIRSQALGSNSKCIQMYVVLLFNSVSILVKSNFAVGKLPPKRLRLSLSKLHGPNSGLQPRIPPCSSGGWVSDRFLEGESTWSPFITASPWALLDWLQHGAKVQPLQKTTAVFTPGKCVTLLMSDLYVRDMSDVSGLWVHHVLSEGHLLLEG